MAGNARLVPVTPKGSNAIAAIDATNANCGRAHGSNPALSASTVASV